MMCKVGSRSHSMMCKVNLGPYISGAACQHSKTAVFSFIQYFICRKLVKFCCKAAYRQIALSDYVTIIP